MVGGGVINKDECPDDNPKIGSLVGLKSKLTADGTKILLRTPPDEIALHIEEKS